MGINTQAFRKLPFLAVMVAASSGDGKTRGVPARKRHWGQWVAARAEFVGFKRQEDLAGAVGCTRERIVRWVSLESPPAQMRKGFDRTLLRALWTDRQMLFHDFAAVSPDAAPRVLHTGQHFFQSSSNPRFFSGFPATKVLDDTLRQMTPAEVEGVLQFALMLVLAKNDRRRQAFEQHAKETGFNFLLAPDESNDEERD